MDVQEAKDHLRVTHAREDAYITGLVAAARGLAEEWTGRGLITQSWQLNLDFFPRLGAGGFLLPKPPLQSVTSVKYLDTAGTLQTWTATEYIVDAPAGPYAMPGRIDLAYGKVLPSTQGVINAVRVTFVAGYGTTGSTVPRELRQAILLILGTLYDHRKDTVVGAGVNEIPMAARALLAPFDARRF